MQRRFGYGRLVKWMLFLSDIILFVVMYFALASISGNDGMRVGGLTCYAIVIMAVIAMKYIKVHSLRVLYADKIAIMSLEASAIFSVLYIMGCFVWDVRLPWQWHLWIFLTLFFVLFGWWFLSRRLIKFLRGLGFNYRRVVVVGSGRTSCQLTEEFLSDLGYGYRILGFFGDETECNFPKSVPCLGASGDVSQFLQTHSVDEIYFEKSDQSSEESLREIMAIADENAIDFYYLPHLGEALFRPMEVIAMGKSLVLSMRRSPLSQPMNAALKRIFDLVVSSVVLILSPIILIPVAVGVKLSSKGPVFFKQERTGYRGKSFKCYKFRSMRVNDESDSKQAVLGDSRKTRFGEFLRKTSIDELPQFYNVWRGDMSIVGPRPHMLAHTIMYNELIDRYMMRHTVKPGITGWAQIRGFRGPTPEVWMMEKRVEYDIWYIENWNFMLDLKIIFLTIFNIFRGDENAL